MAVHFIEEDKSPGKINRGNVKKWLEGVVLTEGKEVGVTNVIFCSDAYLVKINKEFLKRDYFTDVITFDYSDGATISGDIIISVDRTEENAREMAISGVDELRRVMVHGILHLIGYNDDTIENKAKMTSREDLYLGQWPG
ncbi:MAG: rRNA maturation RNase YbeY [Bacteroidetes bacterium GWF2_49_14]|nr:MAG: rRNA maturation RNase YbeY [Bacteroidetes bacterium GWF2_49_14]HBB90927.1 rRNA maturation RNase YbeY [Bacteroidales bacterium]